MVKNYMESLVEDTLQKELESKAEQYADLCRCGGCIASIQVTALNMLRPFYVTCIAGEVYGEYHSKDIQHNSDVVSAVTRGIEQALYTGPHAKVSSAPLQ